MLVSLGTQRAWSNSREVKTMTVAQAQAVPRRSSRFMEFLTTPWVDKTIAVIAVIPISIELYRRYTSDNLSFPRAVLGIQGFILIITMVLRRTPVKVTPNPWYWLLAFVATYGLLFVNAFAWNGRPIVPSIVTNGLAILSAAIFIYARLSLGRSIGMVPANRGIVSRGAYKYVRHPIYTGLLVAMIALVLRSYAPTTLLAVSIIVLLFVIKSVVEERFLRADPEYAAYLQRVRYRWIPGVA
jgi:protein-S-isoprenylcysteine O-methyltransferase Ste14